MDHRFTFAALTAGGLVLCSCASTGSYVAPPGVSASTLKADHRACIEESGIVRLRDEQIDWEQQCMMSHGYTLKP